MKAASLASMSVDALVERFIAIAIEQDDAMLMDDNARFKKLYWEMDAIEDELKGRSGDQRRALFPLYWHANMQVRLKAAIATLAVAPEAARQMLQAIRESQWQPQAGDAGMTVVALDNGTFVPE